MLFAVERFSSCWRSQSIWWSFCLHLDFSCYYTNCCFTEASDSVFKQSALWYLYRTLVTENQTLRASRNIFWRSFLSGHNSPRQMKLYLYKPECWTPACWSPEVVLDACSRHYSENDVSFTSDSLAHPITGQLRSVITTVLQGASTTSYRQSYNLKQEWQSQFLSRLFLIHAVVHTMQQNIHTSVIMRDMRPLCFGPSCCTIRVRGRKASIISMPSGFLYLTVV